MYALSVCEDERLKLAINLSFSCSLRLGELLGLTWDCVDISPEAIEENRSYVFINKESQRIRKESLDALDGKDVLLVFPTNHKKNSTVHWRIGDAKGNQVVLELWMVFLIFMKTG